MKDGNTSGLKRHLMSVHKSHYQELFGLAVPKNQQTLEAFAKGKKVSIT